MMLYDLGKLTETAAETTVTTFSPVSIGNEGLGGLPYLIIRIAILAAVILIIILIYTNKKKK